MFVMDFMGSSYRFCIPVVGIPKYFKSLVNKNIVHQKIGHSVNKNSNANGQSRPKIVFSPKDYKTTANDSIKNKEKIIAFKPRLVVFFVVILMQHP